MFSAAENGHAQQIRPSSSTERRPSSIKLFATDATSVVVSAEAMAREKQDATAEQQKMSRLDLVLRYASLALMVCQYVCQVLLTRHTSVRPQPPFIKTVAIVFKEALEAFASFLLFCLLSKPKEPRPTLLKPQQYFPMLLPALAYTLKNFLIFVAIDHLDAATFTVSYQLKILATALFLVLMLKRRLSPIQWLSLCVLVGGVAMVELSAKWTTSTEEAIELAAGRQSRHHPSPSQNTSDALPPGVPHASKLQLRISSQESFWVGFGSVLGACVLSGYSGVYLEMVVKRPGDSLWLRNFQLCFLSAFIALAIALLKDFHELLAHGPLTGFDALVWAVVSVQVLGGLLVAMVIRYGDNILKAFANAVAILVISVLSFFLFNSALSWLFVFGTGLVVGAMVLYTLFPSKTHESGEKVN